MAYRTNSLRNSRGENYYHQNHDRFIPSSSSHTAYRADNSSAANQDSNTLATNPNSALVTPSQLVANDNHILGNSRALSSSSINHDLLILSALGYGSSSVSRVFSFQNSMYHTSPVVGNSLVSDTSRNDDIVTPDSPFLDTTVLEIPSNSVQIYPIVSPRVRSISTTGLTSRMSLKALTQEIRNLTGTPIALTRGSSFTDKKAKKPKVLSHIPYRILDAPRLRNDFYSNLVAWSRMTGQVAVGLGIDVYIWTEYEGAVCLNIANRTSPVMSLAFSETNILMIGYKSGKILMFDINKNKVHARYNMIKNGVCCGLWSPGSSTTLFVGDEIGNVLCLRTTKNGTPPSGFISLEKVSILKAHQQQICGMAISPDNTQIAIGGNDNLCTVWDIRNISEPKLQYRLPHKAAVKALAFCPWSSALLATGGGSFDRTIRFWHTNSGTLLESLEVQGQVTSLVWSRHYRQIAATFGFSNPTQPKLVSVYSFPKCIPLVQVPATANLRVLSAVLSPDGVCICVASNDETIRFYELWATKDKKVPHVLDYPQSGMFGSDLIELEEGIDKNYDIVR